MNKTAAIVLSKDRALQCEASLRSFLLHCRDPYLADVIVYWTASSERFAAQYEILKTMYPMIQFIQQGESFRTEILSIIGEYEFLLGLVDDNLYLHGFSIRDMEARLTTYLSILGFTLRLGKNTDQCFMAKDAEQKVPIMDVDAAGVCTFDWPGADLDFGYALEWSSTMYRTADLLNVWKSLDWNTPHGLEASICGLTELFREARPVFACYEKSASVSNALNVVKEDHKSNPKSDRQEHTVEALANAFDAGDWVNVNIYSGYEPRAAHAMLGSAKIKRPEVSIIIPSYKKARWLPDCINSIVEQDFIRWEVIILNDCSPDDTEAVAEKLIREHRGCSVRLINSYYNSGVSCARNSAIYGALGEYVFPLDADDLFTCKNALGLFVRKARETGADVVYSDYIRIGDMGGLIVTPEAKDFLSQRLPDIRIPYFSLFKKELWNKVGGYKQEMTPLLEDWEFWTSCIEAEAKAAKVGMPLLAYRIMRGGMNLSNRDALPACMEKIRRLHPKTYG